jgi:hypothetical protein
VFWQGDRRHPKRRTCEFCWSTWTSLDSPGLTCSAELGSLLKVLESQGIFTVPGLRTRKEGQSHFQNLLPKPQTHDHKEGVISNADFELATNEQVQPRQILWVGVLSTTPDIAAGLKKHGESNQHLSFCCAPLTWHTGHRPSDSYPRTPGEISQWIQIA